MSTMHRNLETLLEIQAVESRLRELDADIAALPRRLAAIETKLQGTQQALDRARAAEAGAQSQRRLAEREIETLREKIGKIRGHSPDVKTNQEYKALMDEIAFAEAQIGKHEEQLLQIMEQADGLNQQVNLAEAAVAEQRREIEAESRQAGEVTARDEAEKARLTAQRQSLRQQVSANWLQRFDRVLRMRGQALAAVDREACSGCRVRLRPQFLQEMAGDAERLFVCESCGRILYLEAALANS